MALPPFIRRIFGRPAPAAPPSAGESSAAKPDNSRPDDPRPDDPDDRSWQAGDMAECVYAGPWLSPAPFGFVVSPGPRPEEVRVVTDVSMDPHVITGADTVFLRFARYPGRYQASAFRKIVPQADRAEIADADFLDLTHRLSPGELVQ